MEYQLHASHAFVVGLLLAHHVNLSKTYSFQEPLVVLTYLGEPCAAPPSNAPTTFPKPLEYLDGELKKQTSEKFPGDAPDEVSGEARSGSPGGHIGCARHNALVSQVHVLEGLFLEQWEHLASTKTPYESEGKTR